MVRAEGCYIDLKAANIQIDSLHAAVASYEAATVQRAKSDSVGVLKDHAEDTLTRREKRQRNWKNFGDKLTFGFLGSTAVGLAAYVLWREIRD